MLFLFLFGGLYSPANNSAKRFRPVQKSFPLLWKSKVGSACFRSNILLDSNQLVFGSNGYNFMDYNLYDDLSGLYFINRKNGKIIRHVVGNKLGDMDVNGVLFYQDKLYYGNDNEEFICSSRKGDFLWRLPTSGDIEHEPMLIKNHEKSMIVYATESGEVCAVDPSRGKKYWSYFTPEFSGWKPGDNRAVFKVKSYFSNTQSFFTKPSIADMNKDGTDDLVYVTDDKQIIAINGKTGKRLWIRDIPKRMYDNTITNVGDKINPVFAVKEISWDSTEVYNHKMLFINAKGRVVRANDLGEKNYQFGLNSVKTADGKTVFCTENSILLTDASGYLKKFNRIRNFNTVNYNGDSVVESRNSTAAMISQTVFSYKGNTNCILVMNQHDGAHFENGFVEIISLDSKKVLGTWQLPTGSELAPVVADVNMDGNLDMLISGYDGFLYCYNLGISASNIQNNFK